MRKRKHDIERYLRGALSPAEMHALEKQALNDPFLAEALEGIEHTGAENFLFDLHALNKSVHYRTRARARKNKTVKMWGWTVGIAASVLLIAVSGFLVISLLKDQKKNNLAMKEESPLPVSKTNEDTVATTSGKPGEKTVAPDRKASPSKSAEIPVPADVTKDDAVSEEQKIMAEEQAEVAKQTLAELQAENEITNEAAKERFESQRAAIEDAKGDSDDSKKLSGRIAGIELPQRASSAERRSAVAGHILNGHVRSEENGQALPGVNVMVKGTNIGTVTDHEGNFFLSLPDDHTALVFSFIGLESKEMAVTDKNKIEVILSSDASQLSEVVVTGYGVDNSSADPAPFRFAEPDGGRSQFKNYLSRSLKYPKQALENKAEGGVIVCFTVQPDGKLTDFQVIKGIGHGCEEELIRLVKEGPAWKPSAKENQPITDQVRVRFRFELPKK